MFKGKPNAPFAMIAPGGGFAYVGSLHEGFPIAQSIAEQGYNAFVVKYRAGMGGQIAHRRYGTSGRICAQKCQNVTSRS